MRPLLEALSDGTTRRTRDLVDAMSDLFELTDAEREVMLPSGKQRLMHNRVAWSITHLFQAGLLERPARGHVVITAVGREVLAAHPDRVDMTVLRNFESYRAFRSKSSARDAESDSGVLIAWWVSLTACGRTRWICVSGSSPQSIAG
jgi:restriction system protein